MKTVFGVCVLAGSLALILSVPVWADEEGGYKEAPVANGGSISGKITFKGTPPPAKEFDLSKFPQPGFCGKDSDGKGHRLLHEVTVNNGLLADVVVAIDEVHAGKPFKIDATEVKAEGCHFFPQQGSSFVGVVINDKKHEIKITNMDADPSDPKSAEGVLHNPHGYEVKGSNSTTLFNKPLPTKGQTVTEKIKLHKQESQVKLECDQHNFMNAHFYPVKNPYYAVVGNDGTFMIDQIPPGAYEVHAWHPILGVVEQKITVAANGKATVDFAFAGK